MAVTPAMGAETPLWAATAPEIETITGKVLVKRRVAEDAFPDLAAAAELEQACAGLERRREMLP